MIAAFAALILSTPAPAPAALVKLLRAKDQTLLNAIASGDRAIWARMLTADAVYVDENGEVMNHDAYLKSLEPLPPGSSGHIDIIDYSVRLQGKTALVIHRDDEFENYHGQSLRAQYLMTETWLKQGDAWRLASVHAYVVNHDPAAVTLPDVILDSYVGRYRAAPDLVYVIRRDGDHLMGGVEGKPQHPLLAELKDVLFSAGQPRSRKIFQRDAAGAVTGFLDRREAQDIVWTRIGT